MGSRPLTSRTSGCWRLLLAPAKPFWSLDVLAVLTGSARSAIRRDASDQSAIKNRKMLSPWAGIGNMDSDQHLEPFRDGGIDFAFAAQPSPDRRAVLAGAPGEFSLGPAQDDEAERQTIGRHRQRRNVSNLATRRSRWDVSILATRPSRNRGRWRMTMFCLCAQVHTDDLIH